MAPRQIWAFSILLTILLFSCEPIVQRDLSGKVIKVKDGDSIVLLDKNKREVEIRLAHIDAPEQGQPFGKKSKEFLAEMCAGKQVEYEIYEERDRFGRVVAEIIIADTLNANMEMVRNGYAWHFKRFSTSFKYAKLERSARKNHVGLWIEGNAVPPWEWRDR